MITIDNQLAVDIHFSIPDNGKTGCWKSNINKLQNGTVAANTKSSGMYIELDYSIFSCEGNAMLQFRLMNVGMETYLGLIEIQGRSDAYRVVYREKVDEAVYLSGTFRRGGRNQYDELVIVVATTANLPKWMTVASYNWMDALRDDTPLGKITIPGTHDSAMDENSVSLLCAEPAMTQQQPIEEQLTRGIRFLDMRIKNDGSDLRLVHGSCDSKQFLGDVLGTCARFLGDNPSEFILMRLKDEGGDRDKIISILRSRYSVVDGINWYGTPNVSNNKPLGTTALGDVRGTIVVLGNVAKNAPEFTNRYIWGPSDTSTSTGIVKTSESDKLLLSSQVKRNLRVVEEARKHCAETDGKNLFYVDSAYELAGIITTPIEGAKAINPALLHYFKNNPVGSFGVFGLDFPFLYESDDLVRRLIQTNKQYAD